MKLRASLLVTVLVSLALPASAGRLVVSSDDYTFFHDQFTDTPGWEQYADDPLRFEINVLDWLGGPGGKFLWYGDVRFPTRLEFTIGTHDVVRTSDPSELARLSQYSGLMLGEFYVTPISSSALTDYFVNGGGNIYLYGGTGINVASAAEEAARWADFLKAFGIQFAPLYRATPLFPGPGIIDVSGFAAEGPYGPDLFNGVRYLENIQDQPLFHSDPNSTHGTQVFGNGYFAVSDMPEPSTWAFLIVGLGALAIRAKSRIV